ncbi:putative disease resistance protein RGA3 [Forsythia ovata]|uniref:Disease resistance protein RGA3 n=1 Tax=Forsythia ovata TaxID=205694 RepID=A0ABD1TQ11_9LAMI
MKEMNEIEVLLPRNYLPAASSKSRSTNNSVVMGDDFMEIWKLLIIPYSKLIVVSIVGMGGIGKTTLVKQIYDMFTAHHFDIRAWITVSQEYRKKEVLKGLLNSIRGLNHESGKVSIEKLAENVSQSLKDKRFVIVIDDVWKIKT